MKKLLFIFVLFVLATALMAFGQTVRSGQVTTVDDGGLPGVKSLLRVQLQVLLLTLKEGIL